MGHLLHSLTCSIKVGVVMWCKSIGAKGREFFVLMFVVLFCCIVVKFGRDQDKFPKCLVRVKDIFYVWLSPRQPMSTFRSYNNKYVYSQLVILYSQS